MSKKSDRIAKKAAATVKTRHKAEEVAAAAANPAVAEAVAKVKKEAKPRADGALPALPKLPSATRARKDKPSKACACGCGTMTKSEWAPGHDARAKGWALRIERGILEMEDVPANERQGAELMLARRKASPDASEKGKNIKLAKGSKDEQPKADVAING